MHCKGLAVNLLSLVVKEVSLKIYIHRINIELGADWTLWKGWSLGLSGLRPVENPALISGLVAAKSTPQAILLRLHQNIGNLWKHRYFHRCRSRRVSAAARVMFVYFHVYFVARYSTLHGGREQHGDGNKLSTGLLS